ncbi:hypothetical protein SAMN05444395_102521 [Flavobacterium fryxellicola]|uniref:Uncharacterized protein n=1 Tax=Flavobacterium fryxellicola TaxID=249352 RepID=A0A167XX64_9FLAO|nr:HEPN domain-containing protein [Flavobacterium fryxellicola]OAB28781.1 hypothetical protein FBFR_04735 [Flavobacterium fryxellicola]SHN61780.1 hypothetical protein SAMN05444395_102521 [Flavobacterium fryxellicola]
MHSYFGHIFLPQENNFQKIEGVRLFIDGDAFWIEASMYLFGIEKYNLIKGAFSDLGYVSLIECNVKGFTNSVGGNEGKLSVNYILCGIQIDNEDDLNFSSLSVTMPSLKKWINKTVFNGYLIGEEKMSIKYPDNINFGEFGKFSLAASFGFNQNHDSNKTIILKDYITLKIKGTTSNLSLWEFLEIYRKFKKFLAFINVFDNDNDSFVLSDNNIKYEFNDSLVQMRFYMSSYNFKDRGIDDVRAPKFDIVQNDINSILQNWYSKSEINHSVSLILEKYFQDRLSRETYFLNSCFAIEIYHRRFKNNTKLPSSEFKKLKKAIIDKLETPQEIAFFKEKLSYANEPSFRERLKSFDDDFPFILPDNINTDDFIKKVVLTRNFIVHRGSPEGTISGLELYYASISVEALTKWCIYKEIGFTENHLLSMFQYTREQINRMFGLNKRLQTGIMKTK